MEIIRNILLTAFASVFAENTIFSRAMGTSTLMTVARNRKNLLGFGLSVTYITTLMSIFTYFMNFSFRLDENSYIYKPLVYITVLGAVYVLTLLCMWRFAPLMFARIRKYIHISAFNCAVMGTVLLITDHCETLGEYVIHGMGMGVGFVFAVYLTSIVYERLYSEKAPYAFRGYPLLLIYLGILSMSFWGLSGFALNY